MYRCQCRYQVGNQRRNRPRQSAGTTERQYSGRHHSDFSPLFAPEVDSYVRQRVHNGSLTQEEGKQAYDDLDVVPIQILEPEGLRQRAREIAEQFNQRLCYDSVYAALAELRRCELWTADTRFHRVVKNDLPFVKHIADYL